MIRAYGAVKAMVDREGVTYRQAAFTIGVGRVANVAKIRGFL